jgi:hypothetical protein
MGLTPQQITEYCRIHSERMDAEGFSKTALVLLWAAEAIEHLNRQVTEQTEGR